MTDAKGNTFETGVLELILENKATNAAIAALGSGLQASSTAGSLYISLHTASPADGGDQTTSEVSYTGYARVAVARADASWTVSGDSATNAAAVTFGKRTNAGTTTATHFAIGTASSGVGNLLYHGALNSGGLAIGLNVTPDFAIGQLTVQET